VPGSSVRPKMVPQRKKPPLTRAVLAARQAVGPVQEGGQLGRQGGRDGQDPVAAVALVVSGKALRAQLQVGTELGLVGYVQVEVDRKATTTGR
jgi:hypothetical protein